MAEPVFRGVGVALVTLFDDTRQVDHDGTGKLAAQLVAHPVGRGIAQGLERLAELAAERRERSVATVRSPIALSDQQQRRLADALTRIYRRDITLHLEVDPGLVGGLVIQVGDEVIDGSVAGRLDELSRRLG